MCSMRVAFACASQVCPAGRTCSRAVARWFAQFPAPLGAAPVRCCPGAGPLSSLRSSPRPFGARPVCSSGRGRSGFSVLDPTRSVRRTRTRLKSIGVCGQRFPPTPFAESCDSARRMVEPQAAWAPLQGRGELREQPRATRSRAATAGGAPEGARGTAHPRTARTGTGTSRWGTLWGASEGDPRGTAHPRTGRTGTGTSRWGTSEAQAKATWRSLSIRLLMYRRIFCMTVFGRRGP